MRYKLLFLLTVCLAAVLVFPQLPGSGALTSVFRLTERPNDVIVAGMAGSALTVNLSFGDAEAEELIQELQSPYPLLLIDMDWAGRYPDTVELIKKKNIPAGLLGHNGSAYEQDIPLFIEQMTRFEELFGRPPLYFRTADEQFPENLRAALFEAQVNALGSTIVWSGGEFPKKQEGEIISVPHTREKRVTARQIQKLKDDRPFSSMEDVLFSMTSKTKKIPE